MFAIEGGRPLPEFPLIAHALLTLRLLTGRLRFDEVVRWLRLPFLDGDDVMAGAAIEASLRNGRKLEFGAEELAAFLERDCRRGRRGGARGAPAPAMHDAGRRRGAAPAEWSPRLLAALRQLGWHGARPLRSDEQQTVDRWHALLDEYSALGPWLSQATLSDAVATLADLAAERNFDPASVEAPVTLTESHDDPVVRYDGIWVAGLDAAQWPPPPRPDVFIPLRLQVAAGVPWASAAAQTAARARRSPRGAPAPGSWSAPGRGSKATRIDRRVRCSRICPIARNSCRVSRPRRSPIDLHRPRLESFDDTQGVAVDLGRTGRRRRQAAHVAGGMRLSRLRRDAARGGSARSAGAGHRCARARHVAAQGAGAGVDQARESFPAYRRPRRRSCARRSPIPWKPPWCTSFAATCRSSCGPRSSARRIGSNVSSRSSSTSSARARRSPSRHSKRAARWLIARRPVRPAHRSHRRHRRRRLRHPRLQVRRAAIAALAGRRGARSAAAGLSDGRARARRAGARQRVAGERPREVHRQELAQGPVARRQRAARHESQQGAAGTDRGGLAGRNRHAGCTACNCWRPTTSRATRRSSRHRTCAATAI